MTVVHSFVKKITSKFRFYSVFSPGSKKNIILVLGCGDPEVPAGSVVRPSSPMEQEVSCREGFRFSLHSMEGPGAKITCNKGTWNTTGINCEGRKNFFSSSYS